MSISPLKHSAQSLDFALRAARFQTLVHGDAKPPNFCWAEDGKAAAVDFQYPGKGCGIRDVALFLSRFLAEPERETSMEFWLDIYFESLEQALSLSKSASSFLLIEREWRSLFPVAWCDYERFKLGWSPSYQLSPFSEKQLQIAFKFLS